MDYATYLAELQGQLNAGAGLRRWRRDGDLINVKYIGRRFAARCRDYAASTTPRALAQFLYARARAGPPARRRRRVQLAVGKLCQNERANRCALYSERNRTRYHIRDVNPGCALAMAALFELFRGTPGCHGVTAPQAAADARSVAERYASRRGAMPAPGRPIFPSATCGCRTPPACGRGCQPSVGAAPRTCVPAAAATPALTGFFKSMPGFAGKMAQTPPSAAATRGGSSYAKKPFHLQWWRRGGPVLPEAAV
jgi:hypothetical protein